MAEKIKKKPTRVAARSPRGFVDRDAADLRAQGRMLETIRRVYEAYGFEPVETPMFEYTDALGKFLPDQDRPNEGVFSLEDDDEQWLSLRYDLTAPLARYVAENFEDLPKPYRSYRAGYVFRNEKPGPGRFRQFMQFDADIVGAPNVSADAEMAMMMADTMEALGIRRGQYVIRVNNRKVLDAVLTSVVVAPHQQTSVLRALDKFDRFGREGVRQLLTIGRIDESGDRTEGAGLSEEQADAILGMMFQVGGISPLARADVASEIELQAPVPNADGLYYSNRLALGAMRDGLELHGADTASVFELASILESCERAGYGPERIRVDGSVVRGLEYYTGPVFEAELLFDVVNEKGEKVRFGSVGGGGRYDGLVSRFLSTPVPATGFSIGVSRLQAALKNLGRLTDEGSTGPVVVTVMDRDRMADYQAMAATLRAALNAPGQPVVPVEVFQGNPKQFGKQLQYADRRGAPVVIIQGGDEKAAAQVQVKDMAAGAEASEGVEDNAEWRAMRAGQELVAYAPDAPDALIERVRAILDRRAGA